MTRIRSPRTHAVLLSALTPVVAASAGAAAAAASGPIPIAALHDVRVTSQRPVVPVNVGEIFNIPPLNGFRPLVVFGLTNQQANDDFSFEARASSSPGGTTLPVGGPAEYFIATFDTGAAGHIISHDSITQFDLFSAGRDGIAEAELSGATGETEFADISDCLGIYMTGFANATGGATVTPRPGSLQGQWNVSIMSSQAGSQLPNIVGAPMFAQYQTVIKTSQPWEMTVAGETERSPSMHFQAPDTPMPGGYGFLGLSIQSFNGFTPTPTYFPSFEGIFNGPVEDNPDVPTTWGLPFVNANDLLLSNEYNGQIRTRSDEFLFDTGAQVSVLSEATAAGLGIFTDGTEMTPPDFTVEVLGVGGIIEVPGYYIDGLRLTTTGGDLEYSEVPVIVLDILDPRDGNGFVPGILGMNLFTQHDLIMNGGSSATAAYIGPRFRQWNSLAGGNWNEAGNWTAAVPNGANIPVTFFDAITSPQTVNVNGNYTVGSISFDNEHRYTLGGAGQLTFSSTGQPASLFVGAGSHTIGANVHLATGTSLIVSRATSTLTMSGSMTSNAGVTLTKSGLGAVEMKHVRTGTFAVQEGRVKMLPTGGAAGTSAVNQLSITGGAQVDLNNNNLVVRNGDLGAADGGTYSGIQGLVQAGHNGGSWDGVNGIVTSTADAAFGLTTLGVATAAQALGLEGAATQLWSGQTVSASSVLVMYTYAGDGNLDGQITGDDYSLVDFNIAVAGADGYYNGDFNYDGVISGDDYSVIDFNIVAQGAPFSTSGSAETPVVTVVPEPAAGGLAILAAAAIRSRRRRGRRLYSRS